MSLHEILAEDRRITILQTLNEAAGYELNEDALRMALRGWAHNVTQAVLRGELEWLKQAGLVKVVERDAAVGQLWIGRLTQAGKDVVGGAPYPGVARPRP